MAYIVKDFNNTQRPNRWKLKPTKLNKIDENRDQNYI